MKILFLTLLLLVTVQDKTVPLSGVVIRTSPALQARPGVIPAPTNFGVRP